MPVFDNRREILFGEKVLTKHSEGAITLETSFDPVTDFLRTKPFKNVQDCALSRQLSRLTTRKYSEQSALYTDNSRSDSYLNLGVRMFIRICYHRHDILGIDENGVLYRTDILEILHKLGVTKVPNYISIQKRYKVMEKSIPKVPSTVAFIDKVKKFYPKFQERLFFR